MYKQLMQKTMEMKSNVLAMAAPEVIKIIDDTPVFVYNKKITKMLIDLDNHLRLLRDQQAKFEVEVGPKP